jgi:pimeloyl-ACP methyl ester carboxylesterase
MMKLSIRDVSLNVAAGIANSRLVFIDRASHNPQDEQPNEVQRLVKDFLAGANQAASERSIS